MEKQLNHFDEHGNAVMVDVSTKGDTVRTAVASGIIYMNAPAFFAVRDKTAKKGDVLGVARVAGIMAVKKTSELIPMCHTLLINKAIIDFMLIEKELCVKATCTVNATGKTGVEMEAMTGVCTALLTVYDMCKAIDKSMEITKIILEEKCGGKSGLYLRGEKNHDL